jgi:hypothetical protein
MGSEYDQICPLVASKRNTRDYTDRFFHSFRIEASSFRHDSQDDESWCCSALRSLQCLSAEGATKAQGWGVPGVGPKIMKAQRHASHKNPLQLYPQLLVPEAAAKLSFSRYIPGREEDSESPSQEGPFTHLPIWRPGVVRAEASQETIRSMPMRKRTCGTRSCKT